MGDSRQLPENWELLPPEVIAEICKKLSAKDLVALKNTAKGFTRFFERYFGHYLCQPEAFAGLIESSTIPKLKDFFTEFFPDAQEIMANPDILLNVLNQLSRENICKLIRCADLDGKKLQADASSEAKEMAHIACFALTTINIRSLDQAKLARAIEYYSRPENSRYRNIRRSLEAIQAILQLKEPLQLTKALIPVDCYLNISGIQNIDKQQADLSAADFSFVNARYVGFRYLNLSEAKFVGALLNCGKFGGCDLTNTDFTDACADKAMIRAFCGDGDGDVAIFIRTSLIGALVSVTNRVTLTDAIFFGELDSAATDLARLRQGHRFDLKFVEAMTADLIKKLPQWRAQINPMIVSTYVIGMIRYLMENSSAKVPSLMAIKDNIFNDEEWVAYIQTEYKALKDILELDHALNLAMDIPIAMDYSSLPVMRNLREMFRCLSDESQIKPQFDFNFMGQLKSTTNYIDSLLASLQKFKEVEIEYYAEKGQPFTPDVEKRLKMVNHAINLLDQAKSAVMQTGDFVKMAEAFKYLFESRDMLRSMQRPREKPKENLLSQVGKLFQSSPKPSTDAEPKPKRPDKKS